MPELRFSATVNGRKVAKSAAPHLRLLVAIEVQVEQAREAPLELREGRVIHGESPLPAVCAATPSGPRARGPVA